MHVVAIYLSDILIEQIHPIVKLKLLLSFTIQRKAEIYKSNNENNSQKLKKSDKLRVIIYNKNKLPVITNNIIIIVIIVIENCIIYNIYIISLLSIFIYEFVRRGGNRVCIIDPEF